MHIEEIVLKRLDSGWDCIIYFRVLGRDGQTLPLAASSQGRLVCLAYWRALRAAKRKRDAFSYH